MEANIREQCSRLGIQYEHPIENETNSDAIARTNRLKRLIKNAKDRLRRRRQREQNGATVSKAYLNTHNMFLRLK